MKGAIADHISEIRNAAGRASVLTAQLLAFSRRHPLEPCVVDVNSLLTNLERSLLRLLGENISVQCHFQRGKEGLHTKVDPGQLTQIILNLVVNARDAMPRGGSLALRPHRSIEAHGSLARGGGRTSPGNCPHSVQICRMSANEAPFEPFFTPGRSRGSDSDCDSSEFAAKRRHF